MLSFGWIKISRKITRWRWYKDGNTFRLFLHLLLTANHEDCDFEKITVKRGQRVASRRTLAKETGMSEREVRTALSHLISTQEVTSEPTSKYTVITVNNYDSYQTAASETTSDRPASDQRPTSDRPQCKNDKNEKNDKNNITLSFTRARAREQEGFTPPTVEQVQAYCESQGLKVDAVRFTSYYASRGWMVGSAPMQDWQAAVQAWARTERKKTPSTSRSGCISENAEAYQTFYYNLHEEEEG